jgi:addiction module HigA family antidote
MLAEEFLKPLGLSQNRLATNIHVPSTRIGEIVRGKRAITPDTALRRAHFFDNSPEFWLNLQQMHDLTKTKLATPYLQDSDWVFASPFSSGRLPYWPDSALKDHVRPVAFKAGITKSIGWHTFRHSLASILGQQGEDIKVIQELLRHASSRFTSDVYQQGHAVAKRSALSRVSGFFVVEAKAS